MSPPKLIVFINNQSERRHKELSGLVEDNCLSASTAVGMLSLRRRTYFKTAKQTMSRSRQVVTTAIWSIPEAEMDNGRTELKLT